MSLAPALIASPLFYFAYINPGRRMAPLMPSPFSRLILPEWDYLKVPLCEEDVSLIQSVYSFSRSIKVKEGLLLPL